MKKHSLTTVLVLSGLIFLTSCLKDNPEVNETVYYGYQQIPNINEYMPLRLLQSMDSLNCLHYGDEPPKIAAMFLANGYEYEKNVKIDSLWNPRTGILPAMDYYEIYEQHKGIATYDFQRPYYADTQMTQLLFIESSSIDSTCAFMNVGDRFERFVNDTIAPPYFKNGYASKNDFQHVYIMGNDPYFTAYFYEIRKISSMTEPLNAVIMSGKVATESIIQNDTVIESIVIQDFRVGYETMMYYNKENILYPSLIANGSLPLPGNVWILKSLGDIHYGEFQQ